MQEQLQTAMGLAERGDLAGAMALLHELLERTPPYPPDERAAAYELLGRCELGDLKNIQAMLSFAEAAQEYEQCGDAAAAAYCRLLQVRKLLDDRHLREVRSQLTPILRDALASNWNDVISLGLEYLGLLCFHNKELRKAAGLLEEALARHDSRKLGWETRVVQLSLANCYRALGEHAAASRLLSEITGDPLHEAIPRIAVYVLMNQGYDTFLSGDHAAACCYFTQVAEFTAGKQGSSTGLHWLYGMARYNLALLAIDSQDYVQANTILAEVERLTREHGYYQLLCGCLSAYCIVELLQDRPEEALRHAQECQEYASQFGDIETRLADYFTAFVFLAVGQLDNAQVLWLYRPYLEDNPEMRMHFRWMRRILEHLLATGQAAPLRMTPAAATLAQRWLADIA